MNKVIKKLITATLLLTCGGSLFACKQPSVASTEATEKIDVSKTQIYVYNFYGGYGSDWLAAAKTRFEELHKDDSYESGKQGVQIYVDNQKTSISAISSQILDSRDEVYFTEYAYYYTLKSEGVLGNITSAVTEPLTEYGETRSIADKMSEEQRAYYGIANGNATEYYAVPHYAGYSGLIYNIDLFDEEGWYFAKTPSDSTRDGMFIDSYNTEKSAGPDGVEGTSDDGLPSTYEEFFILCDMICDSGATPLVWTGANYKDYLNNLTQALAADYEGLDQMMLNYTLTGDATDLATFVDNELVKESATAIDSDNGYNLSKQSGKYYALKFLQQIVTTEKYHNKLAFNGAYSHMNAQEDFLKAGNDGKTKPIAMLCDGCWWEMEAKDTFNSMAASKGESYSKYGRNFGFMPLPKATAEQAAATAASNVKSTLYDELYSLCFMKANVEEWKKPLILDFIRFVNSDESLREYTTITNTVKALDYTMTESDLAKMTTFGKSLVELKGKSNIVYPYSTNSVYANNQSFFGTHESLRATVNGTDYQYAAEAMHEGNISAETYFSGMLTYYVKNWSSLQK